MLHRINSKNERYITDSKMVIKTSKIENNYYRSIMSSWASHQSSILSLLLDDVTGNEEAIAIRQDSCRLSSIIPYHFTGSKSEGLDLPGSDFDFMYDYNKVCLVEVVQDLHKISDIPFCNVFLLCTENVNPGFAFLCCIKQEMDNFFLSGALQSINGVQYLSSDVVVNNLLLLHKIGPNCNTTRKRQGPSMEFWLEYHDKSEAGTDHVMSIHCPFWPNDASEWIRRPRHYGWPTSHDISTIVDFGCHLVPVGHPNSKTKTLEWRISFSIAERTLVFSFNHVQMQCYAVMKIILKEFIKKRCSTQNQILCSYFIKTFLFWKFEETDLNFWCKNNFRECIKYLLTEFSKSINDGVLRHYFFPNFNLLSVKLTREAQCELLQLFDIIIQFDISIIKECKTLQTVWSKFLIANDNQMNIIHNAKKNIFIKNDGLMMDKFNTISKMMSFLSIHDMKNIVITDILNNSNMNVPFDHNLFSKLLPEFMSYFMPKQLTLTSTLDEMLNHIVAIPCKTSLKSLVVKQLFVQKHIEASMLDQSNKALYHLQRAVNDNNVLCDLSKNKIWCAIVLLKKCDYTSTLCIISQVLSSVPPFALYESGSEYGDSKCLYLNKFLNLSYTVMERAKEAWITDLTFHRQMIEILPLAIQIEVNCINASEIFEGLLISISPFTCAYYLMFLCYHQLCQYDNRDRALQQLIDVVNNREQCGRHRHHSFNIAGHCLLMTGERDRARDMFNRSRHFLRRNPYLQRSNAAIWYIRNFCV